MINVLYITFASTNFDGATYSLMDLIRSVRKEVNPIILLRSEGCVCDYFRENGIEYIIHDFEENLVGIPKKPHQYLRYILEYFPKRKRFYSKNQKCVKFVYDILKDRHIDIVHTNNTVVPIGNKIAECLGAKHVWHLRGFMDLDFGWMPFTGWKNMKRDVAKSDAVIGITKAVLYHFVQQGLKNAYSISDAVRSEKDLSYIKEKERYFLFCAGLLSSKKGCDFAIKAFAKSNLFTQGYRLKIIGSSNPKYNKYLHDLTHKLSIEDYVDFIGQTNDVKSYMKKATAFLMCSENEGLGRVSIEAMFYGCLVLGRNSGGTKEFVINNKTGYLFNTIEECSSLMQKILLEDTSIIIKQAQDFARQNFSIENYGTKIMRVYQSVLTKK